jgi:non-heme chloroperoxidase
MTRRRWLLGCYLALLGLAAPSMAEAARAQARPWHDPSPHRVLDVTVEPGVRLEVLDWGGSGPPLVFLPGLGNTAHSFDAFAPRFRDAFRVIGITPRGFGASSRPADGYDSATRAQDILIVLDSLHIDRAILVGHSIAGDELSRFAVSYPDRVSALIYLDAYSYGSDLTSGRHPPLPPQADPPMTSADSASVASVVAYLTRRSGVRPLEAEVRQTSRFAPDGRLEALVAPNAAGKVVAQTRRADYAEIRAPALAIYATHPSAQLLFPRFGAFDEQNRRMAEAYCAALRSWQDAQIERFRKEMRRGTVLEIPGANHYVHYSDPDRVERAMREFLARAALPTAPSAGQ